MSAMTRAVRLSDPCGVPQLIERAATTVLANPAIAVPLRHYVFSLTVGLELMLLDFDAEFEDMSGAIERQLADWRHELDWADYKLVEVAA